MLNPDFAKDPLESSCSCGETATVFMGKGDPLNFHTICPKCGKKVLHLWCEQHGAGYCFSEDSKVLNLTKKLWKCPDGSETLQMTEVAFNKILKSYRESEIPKEVAAHIRGTTFLERLSPVQKIIFYTAIALGFIIILSPILISILIEITGFF